MQLGTLRPCRKRVSHVSNNLQEIGRRGRQGSRDGTLVLEKLQFALKGPLLVNKLVRFDCFMVVCILYVKVQ